RRDALRRESRCAELLFLTHCRGLGYPLPAGSTEEKRMTQENLNPFAIAQKQFDQAAEHLKLDQSMRTVLRHPKRALIVSVPTQMDDGAVRVFEGYRVQHNIARGPAKGGIRFHPNV